MVIKSLGKGHFQPVDITTGNWGNNQAEILSGLNEGDEVVVPAAVPKVVVVTAWLKSSNTVTRSCLAAWASFTQAAAWRGPISKANAAVPPSISPKTSVLSL